MAEKLRLGREVRELKIGQSFTNAKAGAFHAVRYDFKPASVDINKISTLDVANNNQVTVTVPHLDGAGVPKTVFKGSQRPFTKECVLIIDKATGQITLEKLSSNMQVKKTRSETAKPSLQIGTGSGGGGGSSSSNGRSQTPTPPLMVGQRQSNKTRVTSGGRRPDRPITHLVPKHSPLHASPNHAASPAARNVQQQQHQEQLESTASGSSSSAAQQSTLPSLPMIGIDDFGDVLDHHSEHVIASSAAATAAAERVQEMSDDDDDEDSSSSSSSSDSEEERRRSSSNKSSSHRKAAAASSAAASSAASKMSMPTNTLLSQDLCLSDTGSDSD